MNQQTQLPSILVAAFVILGLGAVGILTTRAVSQNLEEVVSITSDELLVLSAIQQSANRVLLEATSGALVAASGGEEFEEFEEEEGEEYEEAANTLQDLTAQYAASSSVNSEQEDIEALQQAVDNVILATGNLTEFAEAGDTENILEALEGDIEDAEEDIEDIIEDLVTSREAILAADNELAQRSIVIGNIITAVSTLAGLTILFFLLRTLAQQAAEREIAAQKLTEQNAALVTANAELDTARKLADSANRTKSEFLATMSHELRTPLNAIIGYSQMLLEGIVGPVDAKQKEYVDRIFANGRTLMTQINDVLDIAKIEAGRMDIVQEPFDTKAWFDSIARETEGLAAKKKLEFETSFDDRLPTSIIGDQDRLKQISLNLLSNAVKFTEKGKISFSVQRRSENTWGIVVKDTGTGIAPHAQEYIFDEFRQADNSSTRKFGGTGLGLSIVRNLTLMMAGNIQLQSKLDEGSTFTVVLPLTEAPEKVANSKPASAQGV